MEIASTDYHDFVIKDGKLVGEFDQMYRKSKECPWHQDEQASWLDIHILLSLLEKYGPYRGLYDLGCGLGYVLDMAAKHAAGDLGYVAEVIGYDIFEAACCNARKQFPALRFYPWDMTGIVTPPNISDIKGNRLFLVRGVLWYVFSKLDKVKANIINMTRPGDLLLISQNFPPDGTSFLGQEVIPNPETIVSLFSDFFDPIESVELKTHREKGFGHNWFMVLLERKQ
jgi:SAM-dependent methyltransferase